MSQTLIFDKLFIFEMANNHMGDVDHGLRIIRDFHAISKDFPFRFAFKFQYRNIDTFIHPLYKARQDIKYVKRFLDTRLSEKDFRAMLDEMQKFGFVSICTPFDEASIDLIEQHDFKVIKIASCSFSDWPLLERIAVTEKPIIASTAGASLDEIDKVVTFFEHRRKQFCLMHCVGEYPTKIENLQLNQIDLLRQRYPGVPVGYSTHEQPDNRDAVKIAIGKGASVFERHVGVKTEKYNVNAYSSTPQQIQKWLEAAAQAYQMCGVREKRNEFSEKELSDLRGLKRGVFAQKRIVKGDRVRLENTFLAIPNSEGQMLANDLSKYAEFIAEKDLEANKPVLLAEVRVGNLREKVLKIITSVSSILKESKTCLPNKLELELSHHYGIDRFEEWGAAIINCINREYCKKMIILLPGQKHPAHHHARKEETFHVLYGNIVIALNGEERQMKAGDMVIVERGVKHSFRSSSGAIFEEISTTHYKDDSFYEEEEITKNKNRKTEMTFWVDWLYKDIL